ncbi:MAG TPA: HD-GYP domain-containing protein [Anaerovoracaceae bacterium]|nr:HD-GYP domain-containing protein [Anaerovoracaceae bacterium]
MQNNLLIYHDLVAGIVTAMDARDPYTACHSARVSDITEQICLFLRLDEEEAETIHIAAHVHDIGKIGVPDSVLTKSSALTDDEWKIMKDHSEIGSNILGKIEGFHEIAQIVLYHHEKWNGKGYPEGLKEEEIPFGSRVISVADSIDAMLSDRTYRQAMPMERCRMELERNLGVMYDPVVAGTVLQNWHAFSELYSNL